MGPFCPCLFMRPSISQAWRVQSLRKVFPPSQIGRLLVCYRLQVCWAVLRSPLPIAWKRLPLSGQCKRVSNRNCWGRVPVGLRLLPVWRCRVVRKREFLKGTESWFAKWISRKDSCYIWVKTDRGSPLPGHCEKLRARVSAFILEWGGSCHRASPEEGVGGESCRCLSCCEKGIFIWYQITDSMTTGKGRPLYFGKCNYYWCIGKSSKQDIL